MHTTFQLYPQTTEVPAGLLSVLCATDLNMRTESKNGNNDNIYVLFRRLS
jgi:hypothetical protein